MEKANKKDMLIEILNEAHQTEYFDTFLYLKESRLFKSKIVNGDDISKIFDNFFKSELIHTDIIAEKLIELGGKPVWTFNSVFASNSLRETLERHIESEMNAVKLYEKAINVCDGGPFCIVLRGIISEEKLHLETITNYLKKLRKE